MEKFQKKDFIVAVLVSSLIGIILNSSVLNHLPHFLTFQLGFPIIVFLHYYFITNIVRITDVLKAVGNTGEESFFVDSGYEKSRDANKNFGYAFLISAFLTPFVFQSMGVKLDRVIGVYSYFCLCTIFMLAVISYRQYIHYSKYIYKLADVSKIVCYKEHSKLIQKRLFQLYDILYVNTNLLVYAGFIEFYLFLVYVQVCYDNLIIKREVYYVVLDYATLGLCIVVFLVPVVISSKLHKRIKAFILAVEE